MSSRRLRGGAPQARSGGEQPPEKTRLPQPPAVAPAPPAVPPLVGRVVGNQPVERIRTYPAGSSRLPNGQTETSKWPVLTYGPTPVVAIEDWRLRIFGAVEHEVEFTWADLQRVPSVQVQADFHCVTTWSRYDMVFGGFRVRDLLALARPRVDATHVMQHAYGGYTTNVELATMCDDDVLVVTEVDGAPLEVEHGGPARVVVPKRWAWKGAKWVNGLEVMTRDKRGFWELNGYHTHGDPWGPDEERYSSQEQAWTTRKKGNELRRE